MTKVFKTKQSFIGQSDCGWTNRSFRTDRNGQIVCDKRQTESSGQTPLCFRVWRISRFHFYARCTCLPQELPTPTWYRWIQFVPNKNLQQQIIIFALICLKLVLTISHIQKTAVCAARQFSLYVNAMLWFPPRQAFFEFFNLDILEYQLNIFVSQLSNLMCQLGILVSQFSILVSQLRINAMLWFLPRACWIFLSWHPDLRAWQHSPPAQ